METKQYYWATATNDSGKSFKCIVRELKAGEYTGFILPEWYPELFVDDYKSAPYANFICKPEWLVIGEPLDTFSVSTKVEPIYAGVEFSSGAINEVVGYRHFMEININGDKRSMEYVS